MSILSGDIAVKQTLPKQRKFAYWITRAFDIIIGRSLTSYIVTQVSRAV